ncbi:response regulator [Pseudoalteromonas phenolica]|uniref:Response regulator n=1 Tax=Pseudoalteromonas phenolica TaxID=161398 RepID=A0A5R9Q520_9GAMM|nr:response regulator [Pseudoalteromonas phenolica]TLX48045.1 response regulator [Pseudoalteromonas phenolica]
MKNHNRVAKRHPSILILAHKEEDVHGVNEIISEQTDDYSCLIIKKTAFEDIKQLAPKVLLFALSDVKKSICMYNQLIKRNYLIKNHYSVLLCSNKESGLAFKCCLKKLFDSYFVFQPLYEKFRLQLIIFEGLKRFDSASDCINSLNELVQNHDKEINSQIELGLSYKESLIEEINKSRTEVNSLNKGLLDQLPDDISKKLINDLNEEHLQPLLNALEHSISCKLLELVDSLKHSKSLNNQLIQKLEQPIFPNKELSNDSNLAINSIEPELPQSILLVEDNHIYREMIGEVLSSQGFEVEQVDDGLAAIKKIKQHKYNLILMDLFLPNLDGLNTTKHIRNVGKNKLTPVVALSGNKNKQLVKKWANHGLDGYILKPSTKEEILTTIKKVLK